MSDSENIMNDEPIEYVGFWVRFVASIIDSVIIAMLTFPLLYLIYGAAYFDSTESIQGKR